MHGTTGVDCTWPGPSFLSTHETTRSSVVVAWVAARRPLFESQLRDAMMRSGDCRSAKQVHTTWPEDVTMSEGKQSFQRDVTEADVSRRGAGRTCLMLVVFLRRLMSTLQRSRPETSVGLQFSCCCSVSLLQWSAARKCCSSQVSFMSLVRFMQSGARNMPLHRLSAYS